MNKGAIMADKIKAGNTLSFFYNPDNDLVVVDLTHKNERGGNEILRQTLNEKKLVGFCTKLPANPEPIEDGDTDIEEEVA
jgi:hypothetical protein